MKPGYKDSGIPWIGEIPENWEVVKTAHIAYEHFISNKTERNQNLLSLSYGKIVKKNINTHEGLLPASFDTYQIVEIGNIIFRLTDLQNDKKSLRVGYVNERGIITSAYVSLGLNNKINSKFAYYFFHSADTCKVFYSFGGGVRQGAKWDDIATMQICMPPLEEQQQIASYLDEKCGDIDELIDIEHQMIADLRAYRQSFVTEVVTLGLNPEVSTKETGLPWFPKIPSHWEIRRVKDFSVIYSGEALPSNYITDENIFPVYGGGNILGYSKKKNNQNNLILGRVGGDGHVRFIKNEFWATDNALVIDTKLNKTFLCNVLNCADLLRLNTSTSQPLLTATKIKNVEIPVPPLDEQEMIANYLDGKCADIDDLIMVKQEKIETLKEYRQSLIFETVTGKNSIYNQSQCKSSIKNKLL